MVRIESGIFRNVFETFLSADKPPHSYLFRQKTYTFFLVGHDNFLKNEKGFYPFLRNRVVFPILNSSGKTIGFGGRVIDNSIPKYLNSKGLG